MSTREARNYWDDWGLLLLWLSILSGPAAWAVNQLVGYALVKPACAANAPHLLTSVAAITLLLPAWGGWTAWTLFRRLRHANPTGARVEDRSLLLAVGGMTLSALLGLLIATWAVSPFLLSPCE